MPIFCYTKFHDIDVLHEKSCHECIYKKKAQITYIISVEKILNRDARSEPITMQIPSLILSKSLNLQQKHQTKCFNNSQ